jgi:hypothetical protein
MLTETTLAIRVLEMVGASEDELPLARIISQIPTAVDRLGQRISDGLLPEWTEALRKEFTVTAIAGEADISQLYSSGLISTALKLSKVYQPNDTRQSEWLPDRQSVEIMARSGFPVVAREGSKLVFGDSAGSAGTTAGTVTLRGVAIPVASDGTIDLPKPVESALLDEVAQIVSGAERKAA